jgi:hypothetical protein
MKKRIWFTALALCTILVAIVCGHGLQTAAQAPNAVPIAPLPGSATEYKPPTPSPTPTTGLIKPTASPTGSPTATPTTTPTGAPIVTPTTLPGIAVPNLPLVPIAPPPLPLANPLPTAGEYQDPSGRFRVAILKDYKITPIAGAVMMESRDGSLAYTTLTQPAPASYLTPETLGEIAKNTFKQGEGFRPGVPQPIPGGVRLDWSGDLTIGGQTQPVNGVIVAKPTGAQVLLLLIAATEKSAGSVPNAAAALTDSLQAMQ